ncbi:sugar nucleotide-binding protein [Candidatus Beckwithbacteria bacterium]|nr:sugar nucleotide-binding protein [Candidatus Beckwithbacteria bacterium]
MQIFCTGSSGLVASDFKKLVQEKGIKFIGLDLHGEKESADITNLESFKKIVEKNLDKKQKAALFHFAAFTATGKNLSDKEIELCQKLNVEGTKNVLKACEDLKIPMVHISTDFVFSGGKKRSPYLPSDELCPDETYYSQTKAQAENLVWEKRDTQHVNIMRLAFPYGNFSHPKMGLARKIMTWMEERPEVNLYDDQQICPTPIEFISRSCLKLAQLIESEDILSGVILHVVGQQITPFEFGNLIKVIFDKKAKLNPTKAIDTYKYMVLSTKETEDILGFKIPGHRQALKALRSKVYNRF